VREVKNAHQLDITCLAYSKSLDLIATGSRDCTVRIWDFETMKLESILHGHSSEINSVTFLDPYPIVIMSDNQGVLSMWAVMCEQFNYATTPLVKWSNMHTLAETSVITGLSYCEIDGQLLLLTGDETGTVRLMDITTIVRTQNIVPVTSNPLKKKGNPMRFVSIDM
jgi:WD40 repeat protein